LAAAAVFVFLPFAVLASRSFQPDPLLVATLLAAILAFLRYEEKPSTRRLAVAGVCLAVTFLIKPGIAPPVLAPLLAVPVFRGLRAGRAAALRIGAVILLSLVPMFAWYAYGTIPHSFLRGHFSAKVSPSLLVESSYWNGWWEQVVFVLTYPLKSGPLTLAVVVAALAGVAVARPGPARTILLALWAGYILYGLVFTIHISTHNYYSLPLVPVVALSLGSLVDFLTARSRVSPLPACVALVVAALVAAAAVSWKLHGPLTDRSFRTEEAVYVAAGRAAGHTSHALYVDTHYAEPLRYYGWTAGELLTSGYEPAPGGLARTSLAAALHSPSPPTCLIFTGAALRRSLAGFEAEIAARYASVRKTADFAVYDLTKTAASRSGRC
jgi:4-amino-4-deoxy-L-arabinose transferase-like glycosyltransferase